MKQEKGDRHPLKCPNGEHYTFLVIKNVRFEEDNKGVDYNIPFFECKTCNYSKPLRPFSDWKKIAAIDRKKLKAGQFVQMQFKYENKVFTRFRHLEFLYDSADYFLIPGLAGDEDDGYLTPVFFDKDVLSYYNSHPDFSVRLFSFSSGNIYYKGKPFFNWGFGINRNGIIFKWLGDLNEDLSPPEMKPHLKRFQASNIPSDHDVISTFYFSQIPFSIDDAFQSSDNEYRLFALSNELDDLVFKKFGFKFSKLDIENLSDYYKHPILDERYQIFTAYLSLNKYLIENTEQDHLKSFLVKNGMESESLKGLRSLKLMEIFIEKYLRISNVQHAITPMYVLYDLRQLHGHLVATSFEAKYQFCKERLAIPNEQSDLQLFNELIKRLIKFYESLIDALV